MTRLTVTGLTLAGSPALADGPHWESAGPVPLPFVPASRPVAPPTPVLPVPSPTLPEAARPTPPSPPWEGLPPSTPGGPVWAPVPVVAPAPVPTPTPAPAPAPAPKPTTPPVFVPVLVRTGLPPVSPPPVSEPLPTPQPLPGVPPPGATSPRVQPPPVARPARPVPVEVLAPANAIWGAPPPPGVPCVAEAIPVRHGVMGSPNLTLSRDYRFLDLFGYGLWGDDANTQLIGAPPGGGFADENSFVQAEYLLWWVNAGRVPVLASTAQNAMVGMGYIGQPGTQLLLGPGSFGSTARNGFRVRAGTWFAAEPGVDASYFFLGRQRSVAEFDSAQFPTIARPIFAPNFNAEFGELVAFPNLSTGRLVVENTSELWGADVNVRSCLARTCDNRAEIFAGYRHLNLRESLVITESIQSGPLAPDPPGTNIVVQDAFRVQNRFHGGQVGYSFARRAGRFEWAGRASVALGVTNQELDITGVQNRARPGQPVETFRGGLLAAGPNLGQFRRDQFSVVPELSINLGYNLTPAVKAYVGYNFLYWTNVLRPGDQIDRVIDLTFVPNGPPAEFSQNRPLPTFRTSDLVVQGVQFGLEFHW